jgi:hypothetical protein
MAGGDHDARRPDLDVKLDRLARRQRLELVVRVVRAVRERPHGIELAVRGARPPLPDYTNEFVDAANAFDRAAVIKQAKESKW